MSLDDRTADRQPDTHAAALGRVERVEQLVHALTLDADTGVPHRHAHTIPALCFGSDQQPPRAIVDTDHRVRGVAKEIQQDLLKLNTIAGDGREVVGELRLNDHPIPLKLTQRQRNHLSRGLVQIQRLQGEFLLAE